MRAGRRCREAQERGQHGRLPGARPAGQRDPAAGRQVEGDAVDRGRVAVRVGRRAGLRRGAPAPRADRPAGAGRRPCPLVVRAGQRRGEHLEHPGGRGLPLGAGVELGPGPPQRDEDLGRHQQDGHRGLQVDLAPEEPQSQHHGHEPDAEPGQHVHGQRGEEGGAQRAHGGRAHPFGRRLHLAPALLLAAEGAQGRQPLDQLEEPAGQRAEPAPLPLPTAWPPRVRRTPW